MSSTPQRHRFTSTAFFIWGCLLIWMGNFVFVYVFAALACARRFADVQLLGFAIVPFVTVLASALATVATVFLMQRSWHRMRRDSDPHSNFIRFVVVATGVLVLIAMLYVVLPPLISVQHCVSGQPIFSP